MTTHCPLCDHTAFLPVLHRKRTMVSANRLYVSEMEARSAPAGELTILLCRYCGFVFNATFDLGLVPYGSQYENDQSKSTRFLTHMRAMASRVRMATSEKPLRVVEVGCGQGQFLSLLLGPKPAPHDMAAGFDPSYVGDGVPGCDIHRTYFSAGSLSALTFQPTAVISRHVIEHIPTPRDFLNAIRAALNFAPQAKIFIETPSIEWIFEHNAFWDLCYEHCSYFSPRSLAYAFELCGYRPQQAEEVFGGQYLWIEAELGHAATRQMDVDTAAALGFAKNIDESQKAWRERLKTLSSQHKVAVWGAATKGAMFVQDVDPDRLFVCCLVDINPAKQHQYIPITGHPVVAWQSAVAEGISTIIVTNPNYLSEIKELLGTQAKHISFLTL
jgi:Methyltransferase domain/C-methyltransferase C-terminal domain